MSTGLAIGAYTGYGCIIDL